MKMTKILSALCVVGATMLFQAVSVNAEEAKYTPNPAVMSDEFYKLWNDDVQKEIDARIEKYRKADATVTLENVKPGTDVKVEQISHEFIFGAHIFNFRQLGSAECNQRYEDLYGTLFNSATVAFYWQRFEWVKGQPRFKTAEIDTAEYWNKSENPKSEFHWRRPSSDQCVEFCESKGIRIHGHPMVWGNRGWQHPKWMWDVVATPKDKKFLDIPRTELYKKTTDEIYAGAKNYCDVYETTMFERVKQLAEHYGDRIDSWDVVNESSVDFHGNVETGEKMMKSAYGPMPGDYPLKSFRVAQKYLPESVLLNINDYANNQNYVNQTKALMAAGCKIDIIGSQMHLFNPQQTLNVALGKNEAGMTPQGIWNRMELLSQANLPIHLSEITITAPNDDAVGRDIQAIVARNFYRMWFSIPNMMGITWWNVVDDCGAPGEPLTSGLFTRDMQPKPSFYALDQLINHEWKTNFTQKAENATVDLKFRGFKGKYRITWTDADGSVKTMETVVH